MSHPPRAARLLAGATLLGLLVPGPGRRDATPLELFELALQADVVVEGVITDFDLDRSSFFGLLTARPVFELELAEVVAGFPPAGEARLEIEELPLPSPRYAPYERGQRAIFFLRRPRATDGTPRADRPWILLGSEGEGECPVIAGTTPGEHRVLFRGHGLERLPPPSTGAFGHHYGCHSAPRPEFIAMVRGLRDCFEWGREHPGPPFPLRTLRQTCTDDELHTFLASSDLARAVVRDSTVHAALERRAGP
jgi:hypothetical protein